MTTRIGPATISINLDVRTANRQLEELERRIRDLGSISTRQRDEDARAKEEAVAGTSKIEGELNKVKEQVRTGRFGVTTAKTAAALGAVYGIAKATEIVFPAIAEGLKVSDPNDKSMLGKIKKEVSDYIAGKLQEASDFISDQLVKLTAVIPTIDQFKDITRARMLLGQPPPFAEALGLAEIFYSVNEAQARLERQKDKLLPEYIGKLTGEIMGKGMQR